MYLMFNGALKSICPRTEQIEIEIRSRCDFIHTNNILKEIINAYWNRDKVLAATGLDVRFFVW